MNLFDEYKMKNGSILIIVNGYAGESDFYLMHDIVNELIQPEDSGFSVDSMCVGGYFNKDGLSIRSSSESPYDYCSFFYNPKNMSGEEEAKVKKWITTVVTELRNRKKPMESVDKDR